MNLSRDAQRSHWSQRTRRETRESLLYPSLRSAFCATLAASRRFRTDFSHHRHQFLARHPQVGQREQRNHMSGILRKSTKAHLHQAELTLDHPERMLHVGVQAGVAVLLLFARSFALPSGISPFD